jgi:hypothetical protein
MKKTCPLTGDECMQHNCEWYTQLRGKNPQTGKDIDEWGCAIHWLPILLCENAAQAKSTGAAVESFRNEMVKDNKKQLEVYTQRLQHESD